MNHAVPDKASSRPVRSVGRSTAHKSPAAINPTPAANWATIAIGEVAPYVVTHGMLRHAGRAVMPARTMARDTVTRVRTRTSAFSHRDFGCGETLELYLATTH